MGLPGVALDLASRGGIFRIFRYMHWIAPPEKDADSNTLEKRLWAAVDQSRANTGLSEAHYSRPVAGFIFLRSAEVRFAKQRGLPTTTNALSQRASRTGNP